MRGPDGLHGSGKDDQGFLTRRAAPECPAGATPQQPRQFSGKERSVFHLYSKQAPSQDTNVCAARRLPSGVRPAARQEQSSLGRHGVPNYLYVSSLGAVRCCTHISRRAPCLKPGKGAQRACSEPSRSTRISKDFVHRFGCGPRHGLCRAAWTAPRSVFVCLSPCVHSCKIVSSIDWCVSQVFSCGDLGKVDDFTV